VLMPVRVIAGVDAFAGVHQAWDTLSGNDGTVWIGFITILANCIFLIS
jgi:hypothetical protein